jgi:hypothetical protein
MLVDPLSVNLPPPVEPKMSIPFINDYKFDQQSGVVPKGDKP